MKVLWIAPIPVSNNTMHPAPWITSWGKLLLERQVDLTILTTYKSSSNQVLSLNAPYGKVIAIPIAGGTSNLLSLYNQKINRLSNYIKNNYTQYDIAHIHGTEHQYFTAFKRSKADLPAIVSVQGVISHIIKHLPAGPSRIKLYWSIFSYYEKRELKNASNFFCRTDWDKSVVKKKNPTANIIDLWEIMRPEFYNNNHRITEPKTGIFFPGGSNIIKGLDIALKTLSLCKEQSKNVVLHIMGDCSDHFIQNMLKKLHITNIDSSNYVLHGKVDAQQIIGIYQDCFCVLHTSLIDNSPNSVCEAQVYGMPVIATAVGGVPSLIKNHETGILTSLHPPEIAREVIALYNDPAKQALIGAKASQETRTRHNTVKIIDDTIATYSNLISKNGKDIKVNL